jgi:hypothetical protein
LFAELLGPSCAQASGMYIVPFSLPPGRYRKARSRCISLYGKYKYRKLVWGTWVECVKEHELPSPMSYIEVNAETWDSQRGGIGKSADLGISVEVHYLIELNIIWNH